MDVVILSAGRLRTFVSGHVRCFPFSTTLYAGACLGLWLTWLTPAVAQKPSETIQLRYIAPADCPDREAVLRAIDGLVDRNARLDSTLDVDARINSQDNGEYSLNLRWRSDSGAGQRSIDAESCQAAADAAAWLLALALKKPDAEHPEAKTSESADALRFDLGFDLTGAAGLLPGVGLGAHARAGIDWSALHAGLAFGLFPSKRAVQRGAAIDLSVIEVGAEACYLVRDASFAVGPCALATLGQMAATSHDLRAPDRGSSRFQMLGIGAQLRIHIASAMWFLGDATLAWHQRRPIFVLTGAGTLHQPSSIGARLDLGFVWVL
jgi:hypothetical protein